jgi:hypothetical protein
MNKNAETIIKELEQATVLLNNTLHLLKISNDKGKQLDYTTNSNLSYQFDKVFGITKEMNRLIYQGGTVSGRK